MSVSLYRTVSSKNGNFPDWRKQNNVSRLPFANEVTIYKDKFIFPLSNNQYDLEFEIEKTERFCLKTKEKNNTGDLKSDTLGTRGFFSRPDDTSLSRSLGSNKDLTQTRNRN